MSMVMVVVRQVTLIEQQPPPATQQRIGGGLPPGLAAQPNPLDGARVQVQASGTEILQIVYTTDLADAPRIGDLVPITVGSADQLIPSDLNPAALPIR